MWLSEIVSSTALISVEEYLKNSEKPLAEYIDGRLHSKAMPTKRHALVQWLLVNLLRRQGVEALSEVTVRISDTKFLVPDVIAAPQIEDPYPTTPVQLCVEILSPEDRLGATLAKCEDYHAWGVPFCWVVDPLKKTAWEYHTGCDPVPVPSDGILRAGQLAAPVADLFDDALFDDGAKPAQ
jgi:Uma2 family endonuclease